jgi:hypothetical protein
MVNAAKHSDTESPGTFNISLCENSPDADISCV